MSKEESIEVPDSIRGTAKAEVYLRFMMMVKKLKKAPIKRFELETVDMNRVGSLMGESHLTTYTGTFQEELGGHRMKFIIEEYQDAPSELGVNPPAKAAKKKKKIKNKSKESFDFMSELEKL